MRRRHGVQTLRREDGRIVCEQVRVADTWLRRMRGLLFRRSVPSDEGVVLRPSFSIHTMFMQFPIDVVFLDHDLVVQKISPSVRPFGVASSRGAREVVELRAGECERRGLAVGDRVAWAAYQPRTGPVAALRPSTDDGYRVLIASADPQFTRLLRFLLGSEGVTEGDTVRPDDLEDALRDGIGADAIVIDLGEELGDALAMANAIHGWSPRAEIFLAGEGRAVSGAPEGVKVFDKWNDVEALGAALAKTAALRREGAPAQE